MNQTHDIKSMWSLAYETVKTGSSPETLSWFANIPHPSEITDSADDEKHI